MVIAVVTTWSYIKNMNIAKEVNLIKLDENTNLDFKKRMIYCAFFRKAIKYKNSMQPRIQNLTQI